MLREYLSSIANAIRSILGGTAKINAQDFANKIQDVYDKGYQNGEENTYGTARQDGYEQGLEEGYENGKQAQYDEWWNLFQPNGAGVTHYSGAFAGERWNDETFKPKYDIKPSGAQYMFWSSYISDLTNFTDIYGNKRVIDFSAWTNLSYTFSHSRITHIGVLNPPSSWAYYGATFSAATKLVTIDKIILQGENCSFGSAFNSCTALENITFEGTLNTDGLNLSYSPLLTHDSLMSVINVLKDNSATGAKHTVTLGTENLAKLTDAEKAIATQKGWTLA